jgi:hypothetical protein
MHLCSSQIYVGLGTRRPARLRDGAYHGERLTGAGPTSLWAGWRPRWWTKCHATPGGCRSHLEPLAQCWRHAPPAPGRHGSPQGSQVHPVASLTFGSNHSEHISCTTVGLRQQKRRCGGRWARYDLRAVRVPHITYTYQMRTTPLQDT